MKRLANTPRYITNLKEEKNLMKNKNNLLKFTNIVLLITMIAIILVSGTFAKYTSTASGTSATVVANWSFNVNDTNIAQSETFEFNLFDTATIMDSDGSAEDDVADDLIAPGTSGAFEITLENTSDVAAQYEIKLETVNANNIPIQFSFTGEENSWTTDLENLIATEIIGIGLTDNVTVQWKWPFGGDASTDTALGTATTAPTITVKANITATQLDKADVAVTPTVNVLEGKSAIFFGDSVAYGYSTNGNGFGYYVDSIANFSNYTNAAVNTAALNTTTQGTNNVIEQMKKNTSTSYDYVIIEGGYGDLRDEPTIGTLTDGYVVSEFDTTTFAGAVEYTLYLATTSWEDARIGFIISYDTPNSEYGVRPDHAATKEYWDIVKEACDKWNVDYLDFFEGSTTYNGETKTYSELFDVTGNTYLADDNIHPTAAGYEFIAPFIADWMKTLQIYERTFEIIEEENGIKVVTSFNDLVFVGDWSCASVGTGTNTPSYFTDDILWKEVTGRASSVNYVLKVSGGETIGLTDSAQNVTYAVAEFNADKYTVNPTKQEGAGQNHSTWLSDDITLTSNTKYIVVSFKNGDGSTSFTQEQLELLPTYLEFK